MPPAGERRSRQPQGLQCAGCARSPGGPGKEVSETRIGLQLAQEERAQLLGASRQRVNQELKSMERESSIRIEPSGLTVRDSNALRRIAASE